jgi:hypothetical protein
MRDPNGPAGFQVAKKTPAQIRSGRGTIISSATRCNTLII